LRRTLLESALPPSTPAAVIESGTLPTQSARYGALDALEALGAGRGAGPVLVVVGATVALAAVLAPAQGVSAGNEAAAGVENIRAAGDESDR
jgi:siroheme synthase